MSRLTEVMASPFLMFARQWSTLPSFGFPNARQTLANGSKPSKELWRWLRGCSTGWMSGDWGNWICSSLRRQGQVVFYSHTSWKGIKRWSQPQRQWHELEHWKFRPLNGKKIVYHRHCHGLERLWDLHLASSSCSNGTCSQWKTALTITRVYLQLMWFIDFKHCLRPFSEFFSPLILPLA